ncbi:MULTISPECIES: sulfur carrier protein ThiS [Enterobacterales]|uniref:Sulfur carrier protein ThiS n=2 Tax=Enterobacterales TaxID=91347 RepID=A0ABW6CE51_RAHSY|nr:MULTISPECIES: sulfur carrier protein ThiS [Enterobacterales]AYA08988.1 sulfur carrier protein ThiS [Rahnella aquatilis]MCM2448276.1 sulfur carrier protein ThiS [Rahnella sp. CG8]MQB56143.1 sulfur carrier protein ThiS [Rahnella sp. RcJ3]AZP44164.1 sulfur carrier protein ThiS [Rahnella aquatilis]AZP48501.1 sulfur carrier protein ThiS [Rahnella aquatilis]
MNILVNDEPHQFSQPLTLLNLLNLLALNPAGSALAVNQVIIPRDNWPAHLLEDGDEILLFQAIAGG